MTHIQRVGPNREISDFAPDSPSVIPMKSHRHLSQTLVHLELRKTHQLEMVIQPSTVRPSRRYWCHRLPIDWLSQSWMQLHLFWIHLHWDWVNLHKAWVQPTLIPTRAYSTWVRSTWTQIRRQLRKKKFIWREQLALQKPKLFLEYSKLGNVLSLLCD